MLHFTVYDCRFRGKECWGRFITPGRTFPHTAFRDLTYGLRGDGSLQIWIVSYDLDTLYVERNRYLDGKWSQPERL